MATSTMQQHSLHDDAGAARQRQKNNAMLNALAAKAAKGDRKALEDLCKSAGRLVLNTARLIYGGEAADTEDIAQEALFRICENIHTLKDPQAFRAWMGRIVANEAHAFQRKNAGYGQLVHLDDFVIDLPEKNEEFLPQEFFLREEEAASIKASISALPVRQREAVVLYYYEGMSLTETARAMQVTPPSVAKHLTLAREKIKRDLKKRGGEMEALALLPMGGLLKEALENSARWFSPQDAQWADEAAARAMQKTEPHKKSAPDKPAVIGFGKNIRWPVVFIAAAVLVMATIGGVNMVRSVSTSIGSISSRKLEPSISGGVVFSGGIDGGNEFAYKNPTGAQLQVQSDNGALTVNEWWISLADDAEAILASGQGDDVGDALVHLRDRGSGVYRLFYSLTDEEGFSYQVNRNFRVM